MATHLSKGYRNQDVVVDGNRYERCAFVNCTLVYEGGELPSFVRCQFKATRVRLDGAAYETTTYLNTLYKQGVSAGVDRVVKGVRAGDLPSTQRPKSGPLLNSGENYREMAIWTGVLAVVTVILAVALWYGFIIYPNNVVLGGETTRPLQNTPLMAAMPSLPEELGVAYDQVREEQLATISSYGWVDEDAGIVRIPVQDAMELIVDNGLLNQRSEGE